MKVLEKAVRGYHEWEERVLDNPALANHIKPISELYSLERRLAHRIDHRMYPAETKTECGATRLSRVHASVRNAMEAKRGFPPRGSIKMEEF